MSTSNVYDSLTPNHRETTAGVLQYITHSCHKAYYNWYQYILYSLLSRVWLPGAEQQPEIAGQH